MPNELPSKNPSGSAVFSQEESGRWDTMRRGNSRSLWLEWKVRIVPSKAEPERRYASFTHLFFIHLFKSYVPVSMCMPGTTGMQGWAKSRPWNSKNSHASDHAIAVRRRNTWMLAGLPLNMYLWTGFPDLQILKHWFNGSSNIYIKRQCKG